MSRPRIAVPADGRPPGRHAQWVWLDLRTQQTLEEALRALRNGRSPPPPLLAEDADGYVCPAGMDVRSLPVCVAGVWHLAPVIDEAHLQDPLAGMDFAERAFAHARLRELLGRPDWRTGELVAFHAGHKMQLLAHDPLRYRQAGRVVAQASRRPRQETTAAYTRLFQEALAVRADVGRHVNALQHCLGMLTTDVHRRRVLAAAIDSYRVGLVPFDVPATLIRHQAERDGDEYIGTQTYLAPYPEDLWWLGW
ncbi:YbgA family protein [Thermomonospora curvata]|uniref:DUF1722 domain-containing protein n=1 Tax=Thermomonospora curvata (strain ATCC 19995 / DSM 43183 / JCM 3096 / KCTC 9072 / NBRC 15933 / NCIMB 10081 / Henssen B9) TaxID=471852 RepID=D1A2Z0_THECD|nr:YbgA family protein [Thermomonospora curvata]ACY97938.1 Protein of unknown function DUF1722 [Thermomonospora curvata DSM 43183]